MSDAVFTRSFGLESGPRVRLRLARASDRSAVMDLLESHGVAATELDVRRLLAYDPVRRRVHAAFALVDGVDTLVGIGAIDLDPDAEVDTLVVDEAETPGLGAVLVRALRAQAQARRVA